MASPQVAYTVVTRREDWEECDQADHLIGAVRAGKAEVARHAEQRSRVVLSGTHRVTLAYVKDLRPPIVNLSAQSPDWIYVMLIITASTRATLTLAPRAEG